MLLYFRGCTAREKLNSISDATEELLKLFNIEYKISDDEKCCGSVLLRTGFFEDAIEQMERNSKDLEGKIILTSCSGCYKTLKEDYKKYLNLDLNIIHISQLLDVLFSNEEISNKISENNLNENNLNENKLNDNNLSENESNSNLKVTYHDPCHLGRHAGEFEAPRNVIKSFSTLVEMDNIREKSRCCGSGGGVKSAYGDLSNSIAKLRIKEAEETGADLLVSACPFCKLNLSQNSDNLEVLDLSEFVLNQINNLPIDFMDDINFDFSGNEFLNNLNIKNFNSNVSLDNHYKGGSAL